MGLAAWGRTGGGSLRPGFRSDGASSVIKTAATLIASGILIGAGASIIWLDLRKRRRRRAFVSQREAQLQADPEIEITIAHGSDVEPRARAVLLADNPQAPLSTTRQWTPGAEAPAWESPPAPPTLEQQWAVLQPAIAASVDNTNAALASARLVVNTPGDPSWSYRNKGYGAYRRLLLDGESLGWLRLELTSEGQLRAVVKAHKEDRAMINATAEVPADGMTAARASELFSLCLKPTVAYATRRSRDSEAEASEEAWASVDSLVASALKATNGALAQAGAQLVVLAPPAWVQEMRRHRMMLSIEVKGDDVARMHIERLPHEMEVAVGVREPHLADLGRRRRIPVEGMTIHGLAEVIAGCAWPAIARFRESRPQA